MPVQELIDMGALRQHPGGWADADNIAEVGPGSDDIPSHVKMFHDDHPIEQLIAYAENTPFHVFFSRELSSRQYEWRVDIADPDGNQETITKGLARSAADAQKHLDEHMVQLAISLIALRDRVVAREALRGNSLRPAPGEASLGGYWDANFRGIAMLAMFKDWCFPLARFAVRETYEDCLILLYMLTEDPVGLPEVMQVAAESRLARLDLARLKVLGHSNQLTEAHNRSAPTPRTSVADNAAKGYAPTQTGDGEPNDLMGRLRSDLADLKAQTLDALGVTDEALAQDEEADFTRKGIELFMQGVEAHTRLALSPDDDLRQLVEMKPSHLSVAIYTGVIDTVEYIVDKSNEVELPIVVRGFMASYALFSWHRIADAGIDFAPGEGKMPADFFDLLGINENPKSVNTEEAEKPVANGTKATNNDTSPETEAEVNRAQLAVRHLRKVADGLGLPVHELPSDHTRADDAFEVQVGNRKQPWWETIRVWRLPMTGTTTFQVWYKRIGDTQGRPISPEKAIRIMQKAARKQGLR